MYICSMCISYRYTLKKHMLLLKGRATHSWSLYKRVIVSQARLYSPLHMLMRKKGGKNTIWGLLTWFWVHYKCCDVSRISCITVRKKFICGTLVNTTAVPLKCLLPICYVENLRKLASHTTKQRSLEKVPWLSVGDQSWWKWLIHVCAMFSNAGRGDEAETAACWEEDSWKWVTLTRCTLGRQKCTFSRSLSVRLKISF